MTTNQTEAEPSPAINSTWTEQFGELRARYPKAREAILVALHILSQNPEISLEDAKAQAAVHGTRITAASVTAARRLLDPRRDAEPATATVAPIAGTVTATPISRGRSPAPNPAVDLESMIRQAAERIRAEGDAEAERLRQAMRQAIAVLTAAMD